LVSEPAEEEESEAAEPAAGDDEPEVDELPTAEVEAASKEEEDLFEATVSEEVLPAEATLDTSAPPPVDTPAVEEMSPIEDEVPVVEAAPVAESAFEVPEMTPAPVEEAPVEPLPVEEAPVESVSAPASEEVTAPIATGDIAAMTEPPVDEPDPGLFDTSSEIQLDGDLTSDEIAQEVEPEPELEDTNIWELEDEEDDDEPTQVGTAVAVAPEPAVGQQTVRLDISALQDQAAAASDSGAQAPEPVAPEPVAPAPVDVSEDPTIMGMTPEPVAEAPPAVDPAPSVAGFAAPPPSFTEPAPPPPSFVDPPPPEPPAAEAPAEPAGGSTQVQPPSDLEGPGLAFATPAPTAVASASSDEEALHEEARRLARLLVSEIKLYNEEIIEEGRRRGNIYERLKDDIDRSRQMYEERIDPRLADKEDYFYQELVQRLAGGDEKLLGM
ncbi:MAG: hypothetical protein AAGD06_01420, partial [Acidobacteriota bacterium]